MCVSKGQANIFRRECVARKFLCPRRQARCCGKREAVEIHQAGFIQARPEVAAGENKCDGDGPQAAPVKDEAFALRKNLARDAFAAAGIAVLGRVHAGIVEAQVKARGAAFELLQLTGNPWQVIMRIPENVKRRALRRFVGIKAGYRHVELPDGRVFRDQGVSAASAMRVEIENQHGLRTGCECGAGGNRQPVEGAKAGPACVPGVVQAA